MIPYFEFILAASVGAMLLCTLTFYVTSTVPRICPGHQAWMFSSISASCGIASYLIFYSQQLPELALSCFQICTIGWIAGLYRGVMRFLYVPQNLNQLILLCSVPLILMGIFEHIYPTPLLSIAIFPIFSAGLLLVLAYQIHKTKPVCCNGLLTSLKIFLIISGLHFLDFPFLHNHEWLPTVGFILSLVITLAINMLLVALSIHQLLNQLESSEAAAIDSALRDPLTDLYNRNGLEQSFRQKVRDMDIAHQSLVIMFIDLDGFKQINDNYGHRAGDQVLTTVAQRLSTHTNQVKDLIARHGGDEFVVILLFKCELRAKSQS